MARRLRLDFPGAKHHVMNRGARRAPVFAGHARLEFLNLLPELYQRFGLLIHAYAVMMNHYHLLVTSPPSGLAESMKWLDQVFAQRINTRADWDGPVLRGRYHDVLVCDPEHWRHLAAYVHLNPYEHGGPERMFDPTWTSHAAFTGARPVPEWLSPGELIAAHGSREAYIEYVAGLRTGTAAPPAGFDPTTFRERSTIVVPEPVLGLADDALLAQVERIMDRPLPARTHSRDPIVGVACWWLRVNGRNLAEIGEAVGLSSPAASRRVSKVLEAASGDAELASRMAALSGTDPRLERAS